MFKRNFLVLALLVVFGAFLVAFSNAKSETKVIYSYVSLTQANFGIIISEQGKETERAKIKLSDPDNYNAMFELLNKYESEGWELFANNAYVNTSNSTTRNYFLLRRKKQ